MALDRDPYYDSARDKPDKSEFGSLRMPMHERRAPPPALGLGKLAMIGIALIVIAVLARHYFR